MGRAIQRVGDRNTAGGVIINGDSSVLINGRPIAIEGAAVSPHPCCGQRRCPPIHCNAKTHSDNPGVSVNGINLIFTDDHDTCGHPRAGGSPDVTVG
jgi:uncharacterized Zn-binding protein involved in type VI secretion